MQELEQRCPDKSVEGVIGVVPAYRPDEKLIETLEGCSGIDVIDRIVVVDDGSGTMFEGVFQRASAFGQVDVLHLGVNSGTGGAIKAGLQYALYRYPAARGFVTFDADGQHHPDDVRRIVQEFLVDAQKTVIGVRDFHDKSIQIPLRSRLGNRLTELVFFLFTGLKIVDTQTGLRCYSRKIACQCTQILRNRYEFQLEALLLAVQGADYLQIPIRTIYEDGNRRSHFNPIRDSMRIYFVFLRFVGATAFCSVLDYVLFLVGYSFSAELFASMAIARIVSVLTNFVLNKKKVFCSKGHTVGEIIKFLCLAVFLFSSSCVGVHYLKEACGISPAISKVFVELALFGVSFAVQRFVIFPLAHSHE